MPVVTCVDVKTGTECYPCHLGQSGDELLLQENLEQRLKPGRGAIYGLLVGGGMWAAIFWGVALLRR
jgi:hypothetical protein